MDASVRSPSLRSLSVFAPRALGAFFGGSAKDSNRSIMRLVVRFMAWPPLCGKSCPLNGTHGVWRDGCGWRPTDRLRRHLEIMGVSFPPGRRLRASVVTSVWPGHGAAMSWPADEWQSSGGVLPILAEVALTGWTRIGLIGPEMAQKRSSPFLYRWPSWSARGELARIAVWDHPADQGARRHNKSMSTPKQGRARE